MKIRIIILATTLSIAILSLFLPFFTVKPWNSFSGELYLVNSFHGCDLFLPAFSLPVFVFIALYILYGNDSKFSNIIAVFITLMNGLYMVLIYMEIKEKSMLLSEARAGSGFYLLSFASLVLFIVAFMNYKYPNGRFEDKEEDMDVED